jgi:hypothetical protein
LGSGGIEQKGKKPFPWQNTLWLKKKKIVDLVRKMIFIVESLENTGMHKEGNKIYHYWCHLFFTVLGIKSRVSRMIGKYFTTWAMSPTLLFVCS